MLASDGFKITHRKGMRRFGPGLLIISVTAQLLSGSMAIDTYAATVNSGTVTVSSGNVRKEASVSSGVSFCVSKGEQLAILGEEKGKDGSSWYKVSVGNSVGYIRSDLVKKTDNKITVSDSLVSKDDSQESLSSSKTSDTTNDSSKTGTDKDKTDTKTLSDSADKGTVNADYVRIRNGASTSSGIVGYLNKGTALNITGEGKASDGNIWYQVEANGETGFIRADYVTKTASAADSESGKDESEDSEKAEKSDGEDSSAASPSGDKLYDDTAIVPGKGIIKGTSVRIRSAASTDSDILLTADSGEPFSVIGMEEGNGLNFYKVIATVAGSEKVGYVATDYFQLTQSVTGKATESKDTEEEIIVDDEGKSDESESKMTASIKGTGVRIRTAPVSGDVICQLSSGHPLEIKDEVNGEDGNKWYEVAFSYLGNAKTGYVRNDFVINNTQSDEEAPLGDEEFEASIAALPDSYKNSLRALHASHPKWKFEVVDTGLDWNDALTAESSTGKNLVSKNSIASWKSTAAQAYNWSTNTWYTFDGDSWVSASKELIAYYLDPRNFLNESGIYQFECLEYSDTQTADKVSRMLTGTFMSDGFTDADGTSATYQDVFAAAGQMVGVSPYLLAGRAVQEQGIYGNSQSISGNVGGYEGYYNYFNIGAYAYGGKSATINGLIYASGSDEENARPWNTRIKSIYGGAKYIAEKFVSKGQNTLYFQKFNVVNSENTIYSHQYMNNIQAASSESARLQLTYIGDDEELVFRIPFYKNMPSSNCAKPTSDSSPNTYLSSLAVEGYDITPQFSGNIDSYTVNVSADTENVTITASPVCDTSAVGGTGTYNITDGVNTFYVACKAQNGQVKTYVLNVVR